MLSDKIMNLLEASELAKSCEFLINLSKAKEQTHRGRRMYHLTNMLSSMNSDWDSSHPHISMNTAFSMSCICVLWL